MFKRFRFVIGRGENQLCRLNHLGRDRIFHLFGGDALLIFSQFHLFSISRKPAGRPEYSRMSGYHNSRCLANGPSAGATYPGSYQTPYSAYQQPVAVFPGGSIVGRGYSGDDYRSDRDRRY